MRYLLLITMLPLCGCLSAMQPVGQKVQDGLKIGHYSLVGAARAIEVFYGDKCIQAAGLCKESQDFCTELDECQQDRRNINKVLVGAQLAILDGTRLLEIGDEKSAFGKLQMSTVLIAQLYEQLRDIGVVVDEGLAP